MKVFLSQTLSPEALSKLQQVISDVGMWEGTGTLPQDVFEQRAVDCDGLVVTPFNKFPLSLLNSLPKLKVISTISTGYEHLSELRYQDKVKLGKVSSTCLCHSVTELGITLILLSIRPILSSISTAKTGNWNHGTFHRFVGKTLNDHKFGLLGYGILGQQMAKTLRGMGVENIVYHTRTKPSGDSNWVNFDQLLSDSDIVVLCCDLNPSSKDIINDKALSKMKKGSILINISRGQLVDQSALLKHLTDDSLPLAFAATDVTAPEPLPEGHVFYDLPNLIITPHIGSMTSSTLVAMEDQAVENLIRGLKGEPMLEEVPKVK